MDEVEVVVAHHERATLRVGDVFLKIDGDQANSDVEVEAMARAPVPTPEVLWRKPPVLVDPGLIRAWWSLRGLLAGRWLIEHGYDPATSGGEFDVLQSQA